MKTKYSGLSKILLLVVLCVVAYGFASWAIDTGSLLLYAMTIASLYYAIHLAVQTLKQWIQKNDGRGKAKKAR